MRFIHIADIHFDSPFTMLNAHNELGDKRRLEQRKIFNKIIEYIQKENIEYLFISGDLYEHQYVRKSSIEYINNLFKTIPKTKIFISPGNHDPLIKNSYYNEYEWSENVYIFGSEIQKYEFDDVCIYGFGFDDFYCTISNIEDITLENKDKLNVLVAHGDLNASQGTEMPYNPINETKVKKIGFDYVALGHIHKKMISKNIVYPGSTISFGFDELGEHGMLDVSLEKEKLKIDFVKLDDTEFEEKEVDISGVFSEEDLVDKITQIKCEENKLYKIILVGSKNIEINTNKLIKMIDNTAILKIKDKSKISIDLNALEKENSLKGYFLREIKNLINDSEYSEEEIEKAIEIGMQALNQ